MKILRGRNKDKIVEISQWCNDWFTDREGNVYSPTSIQLTVSEQILVKEHNNNGILFQLFCLMEDGKFKRIKRK